MPTLDTALPTVAALIVAALMVYALVLWAKGADPDGWKKSSTRPRKGRRD